MGRSAGAGSPLSFKCRGCGDASYRTIRLTGRTRVRATKHGSARGARHGGVAREYVCGCGHTGWSTHVDLLRWAVRL